LTRQIIFCLHIYSLWLRWSWQSCTSRYMRPFQFAVHRNLITNGPCQIGNIILIVTFRMSEEHPSSSGLTSDHLHRTKTPTAMSPMLDVVVTSTGILDVTIFWQVTVTLASWCKTDPSCVVSVW
jgi:hypothetical protein